MRQNQCREVDVYKRQLFYTVLFSVAAILGIINYATYAGSLWSVIAIGCMIYVALTVRYSITRHANLASKILIQTIAAQALLVAVDCAKGYTCLLYTSRLRHNVGCVIAESIEKWIHVFRCVSGKEDVAGNDMADITAEHAR